MTVFEPPGTPLREEVLAASKREASLLGLVARSRPSTRGLGGNEDR